MKKLVFAVVVATLLVCALAVGVGAKVITVSNNTSEGSAASVEFGDTVILYGKFSEDRFYKIQFPYNGKVTVDSWVEGSDSRSELRYPIYYYKSGDYDNRISYSSKYNAKLTASNTKTFSVSPGYYYFVVEGHAYNNDYFKSYDTWNLYFEMSFECSHIETEEVTIREATCSKEGLIEERCTDCEEVIDSYDIDKLDHTPDSDWTITRETSCEEAGEKVKYCTVCGEEAEVEEIEILDHTWSEWTTTAEPTCEDAGSKYRTCTVCGYKNEREIEELGHEWGKDEVIEKATCEEEGLLSHICEVCGKEEKESIEKEDHRFGSWKTTKKATETSTGEKERTCKNCEFEEKETIAKLKCGDETSWKTTKNATCTTDGKKEEVCDYCGKTLDTETIRATGHEWGEWKITRVPTSSREGEKERECEVCGETEEKSVTLTHGDYGEWKITTEATCTESGKKEFICDCCGRVTETETIKKKGHDFGTAEVTKQASPERDGEKTAKCKNCDEVQIEYIDYDFEALKRAAKKTPAFSDVSETSWYYDVVKNCYHYGLMVGASETTFNPSGNITRAEVITSAVRIYCLFNPNEGKPQMSTSPWYKGYVDFAIEKGIIKADDFSDYTIPATRAEMAYVFTNAVGEENLEKINDVTSIPDVNTDDKYANEIFMLYNAGVLTGSDELGTFNPTQNIVRSESAAIIARISKISDRVKK